MKVREEGRDDVGEILVSFANKILDLLVSYRGRIVWKNGTKRSMKRGRNEGTKKETRVVGSSSEQPGVDGVVNVSGPCRDEFLLDRSVEGTKSN